MVKIKFHPNKRGIDHNNQNYNSIFCNLCRKSTFMISNIISVITYNYLVQNSFEILIF